MKKKIVILMTALMALCGCQGSPEKSVSDDVSGSLSVEPSIPDSPSVSEPPSVSEVETSTPSTTPSTSTSTTITQSVALAYFKEALKKDYSNYSVLSYQYYDDGETCERDIEYASDGYVVDLNYDLASFGDESPENYCSYYYVDSDGVSYMYFSSDSHIANSKGGWLTTGAYHADLSIWNAYFYLPYLLSNISADDMVYSNGVYYVRENKKIEELGETVFSYYGGNFTSIFYDVSYDLSDIAIYLSDDGHLSKIYAFYDSVSDPVNFICLELQQIGSTTLPYMSHVPAFSENSKSTYWEYKGWPHDYEQVYYQEVHTSLAPNQSLNTEEGYDVVSELDEKFLVNLSLSPTTFEPWEYMSTDDQEVTWHYDKSLLEMKYTSNSNQKQFRAIHAGTTEIYATVQGKDGVLESEHIRVKVNALPTQDKTNAIYDFDFVSIDTSTGSAVVTNLVQDSVLPYEVTVGPCVSLIDGRYSDLFEEGRQYTCVDPSGQEQMNKSKKPGFYFNFGDQQVSKISFNYGYFYSSHVGNLWRMKDVKVRTSNDGVNFNEKDITADIKNNISENFVKMFECEFEPASIVELVFGCTSIGGNLKIGIDSICFFANENCSDHVVPGGEVEVTSVTISAARTNVYVGEEISLAGVVLPTDSTNKTLTWHIESGKESVVSINANGKVKALSVGSARVWATASNGVKSNELVIKVEEKPTLSAYVGNHYFRKNEDNESLWDEDYFAKVLDEDTVEISVGTIQITANVVGYTKEDNTFYFKNDNNEEFKIDFAEKRADLYDIKYLGENGVTSYYGTYYLSLQVYMTNFTVKVGSLTANASGKYDVYVGDTTYLTISYFSPSSANVKDVVYSTSNKAVATVLGVGYDGNTGEVNFLTTGEVTIRISSKNDASIYKEVTFVVSQRVYPTDSNWSITANKEISDGTITIVLSDSVKLGVDFGNITHNTSATYESSDPTTVSIGKYTGEAKGLKVGSAVITVRVKKEDNSYSEKQITIVVEDATEGEFPAEVVGIWEGEDDNGVVFTFTVNKDGTAVLENEYGEATYHFSQATVKETSYGTTYSFECIDGDGEIVTIEVGSVVNFGINTDIMEGMINDYYNYYFSGSSNYQVHRK